MADRMDAGQEPATKKLKDVKSEQSETDDSGATPPTTPPSAIYNVEKRADAIASLNKHIHNAKQILVQPLLKDFITDDLSHNIMAALEAIEQSIPEPSWSSFDILQQKQQQIEELFRPLFTRVLEDMGLTSGMLFGSGVPENVMENASMNVSEYERSPKKRAALLVFGSGIILQSLIDYSITDTAGFDVALVITNVSDSKCLEIVKRAGILTKVISQEKKTRDVFEDEIDEALTMANIEFVCLDGFKRILTEDFVKRWTGRIINIHPSLLPLFSGDDPHKLVLESGVRITGCTVYFMEPEVDSGAIILQGTAPVFSKDTEETLGERVELVEHKIFPKALDALAKGHVRRDENLKAVWNDDRVLESYLA